MDKNNSAHDRHIRYLIKHKKASKLVHYVSINDALINAGLINKEEKK